MPYVIRRPHKRASFALAAACFALLVVVHPAAASADTPTCVLPSASQVFAPLGDSSYYAPLAGGTFEGDMSGWSLNGASVVAGNESYNVGGSGTHSLSLTPGGTAVSPSVCVNSLVPTYRFFAQSADGSSASYLHVAVQVTDPWGHVRTIPAARLNGGDYTQWTATPALVLGEVLPPGVNVNLRFVFSADPNGGAWSVDDVYLDPYAR